MALDRLVDWLPRCMLVLIVVDLVVLGRGKDLLKHAIIFCLFCFAHPRGVLWDLIGHTQGRQTGLEFASGY